MSFRTLILLFLIIVSLFGLGWIFRDYDMVLIVTWFTAIALMFGILFYDLWERSVLLKVAFSCIRALFAAAERARFLQAHPELVSHAQAVVIEATEYGSLYGYMNKLVHSGSRLKVVYRFEAWDKSVITSEFFLHRSLWKRWKPVEQEVFPVIYSNVNPSISTPDIEFARQAQIHAAILNGVLALATIVLVIWFYADIGDWLNRPGVKAGIELGTR